jgi:hypothetical protein
MFFANNQLPLIEPQTQLPKYLVELLEKGWTRDFREKIFPYINEERFAVLYSKNRASRPNSPVNVIVGLLILKEVMQLTDEELIGSLHFDTRFQYALNTMGYEVQPVSINTLTNFRRRLANYLLENEIDLVQQEVEALSQRIAKELNIDQQFMRMDSFMMSSSCKKLSRIELVYSVNQRMVKAMQKIQPDIIPDNCKGYLEKGHKNETIYRTKDQDTDSKLETLFKQTEALYAKAIELGGEVTNSQAFSLLSRFVQEQTSIEETRLLPKLGKEIAPDSLQNPTDPDATYRYKYGSNTGYVANVVNAYNETNQVISHYDLQPNIYSDQKFAQDTLEQLGNPEATEKKTINVDGTYYTDELAQTAAAGNIDLIPGQLTGTKPNPEKLGYDHFEVDEPTHQVNACPAGYKPEKAYYDIKAKSYTVKMSKEICADCPLQDQCPIKNQKKDNVARFSEKRYHNDQIRSKMNTKEYHQLTNCRAAVEGIPSVMRRRYRVDEMPIRGLVRSKIWFGFKIAAFNFKCLVQGLQKLLIFISIHFQNAFLTKFEFKMVTNFLCFNFCLELVGNFKLLFVR